LRITHFVYIATLNKKLLVEGLFVRSKHSFMIIYYNFIIIKDRLFSIRFGWPSLMKIDETDQMSMKHRKILRGLENSYNTQLLCHYDISAIYIYLSAARLLVTVTTDPPSVTVNVFRLQ